MSSASLAAIFAYALAAFLCARAAGGALHSGQSRRQLVSWRACTAFYGLLIVLRLLDAEDQTRRALRTYIRTSGEYDSRWLLQAPLVAVTLVASVALLVPAWRAWTRRRSDPCGLLALTGLFAICAFVPLYTLRMISLHSIDGILYGGSLPLNWVLDLVLVVITGVAAYLYARRCT